MTEEFIATDNGNINISEEVIIRISAISAREVEGVAGLWSSSSLGDFLGKKNLSKGIKVETKDDNTEIDVHITVKFGVKINDVALKVQDSVKTAVEEYAGIQNIVVNVYVDGIENEKASDEKNAEVK